MRPPACHPVGPTARELSPVDIGPWRLSIHSLAALVGAISARAGAQPSHAPWTEPPRLPAPGALIHYTMEAPTLLAVLFTGLSLAMAWAAFRAGRTRVAAWLAVLGPLGAVGTVVLAASVETAREIVIGRGLELARTLGKGDPLFAESVLSPTLYLKLGASGGGGAIGSDDRELVLRASSLFRDQVRLEGVATPGGHASADSSSSARTRLRVRTGGGMGPSLSWWQLDWRRDPDGEWRVYTIELLLFNGQAPSASFGDEARRAVR